MRCLFYYNLCFSEDVESWLKSAVRGGARLYVKDAIELAYSRHHVHPCSDRTLHTDTLSADGTDYDAVVLSVVFVVHGVRTDGSSLQFRYVYQMTVGRIRHRSSRRYGHIRAERHDGGQCGSVVKRRASLVDAIHLALAYIHGSEGSAVIVPYEVLPF